MKAITQLISNSIGGQSQRAIYNTREKTIYHKILFISKHSGNMWQPFKISILHVGH